MKTPWVAYRKGSGLPDIASHNLDWKQPGEAAKQQKIDTWEAITRNTRQPIHLLR
jgi:hypothetical protein